MSLAPAYSNAPNSTPLRAGVLRPDVEASGIINARTADRKCRGRARSMIAIIMGLIIPYGTIL